MSRHVHLGPGAALDPRRQAGGRRRAGRAARAHATPARCSRATCSSRSRASASTPTISWPKRRPRAPWRRSRIAAGCRRACPGIEVRRQQAGAGHAGSRLARAVQAAADRRHRQQRQDHRHADDRVDPARLAAARRMLATQGNFNNDIGLPLTLLRPARAAPHRGDRAGHEPSGRDRLPGRHRARRPSRWSTTRSASTRNSWPPWKRWRAKTAAVLRRAGRRRRGGVPRRRGIHAAVEASWRGARACMTFGDAGRRRHRSGRG